jgi:Bacterial pre-peptidase C-terminal domain/Astacin (Peptidase family M12A)
MSQRLKICHDRVLPTELLRPQSLVRRRGLSRAVLEFRKMWVNGSRLRVRFLGGTPSQQKTARDQAAWWTPHANLTFDFGNDLDAEIRIAFDANDGAWSYIGTDARQIPRNAPTMNLGFLDGGTAAHEFGHAIGLGHEHQNPSGGIQWIEDAVIRDLSGPPNNWDENEIRHNVLQKYTADQIRGTKFDPESIMLYFFPGSWVEGGKGTDANEVLSTLDKGFIASRDAYPKDKRPITDVKIGAAAATRAKIEKPGEEDIFRFSVTKNGRYVIQTGGKSDVVLKLFGPDSETSLIAEDDDSGVASNARISAALVPGEYLAQVRHVKPSATGAYTLRVDRA